MHVPNRWALVLAAGAGTRLRALTTTVDGANVPKQFCSLAGGASLLEDAIERARAVAPRERIVVVVAAEHRRFWHAALAAAPAENIVVQPRNRGTANGILLGVAAILARDAEARLAVLPSDHHVEQEAVLRRALRRAVTAIDLCPGEIRFLGVKPDHPDPELGYIVRGAPAPDGSFRIAQFVEKPSRDQAAELLGRAALWNSFILVGRAAAFADLIGRRFPAEVAAMRRALADRTGGQAAARAIERLYDRLPEIDFSRHVVEGSDAPLGVLPVAACGWSDLGTPKRVAECLARLGAHRAPAFSSTHWSLADAYRRAVQAPAAGLAAEAAQFA